MGKGRVTVPDLNLDAAHSAVNCAHSPELPLLPQAFGKSLHERALV